MLCMKGASSSDAVFLLPLLAHFWPEHSNLNLNLNLNLISNKNQIILLLLNVSISVPLWAISEKISNKRARVSLFQTFPRFFPSFYKLFFQFYLTLSLYKTNRFEIRNVKGNLCWFMQKRPLKKQNTLAPILVLGGGMYNVNILWARLFWLIFWHEEFWHLFNEGKGTYYKSVLVRRTWKLKSRCPKGAGPSLTSCVLIFL